MPSPCHLQQSAAHHAAHCLNIAAKSSVGASSATGTPGVAAPAALGPASAVPAALALGVGAAGLPGLGGRGPGGFGLGAFALGGADDPNMMSRAVSTVFAKRARLVAGLDKSVFRHALACLL